MAAFLLVVGLTGSLLAFSGPLERLINPQLFASPAPGTRPLSLAELAERAEAQEPHARVAFFAISEPGQIAMVVDPRRNPKTGKPYAIDFDHILLDPYTGRELGRRRDGDLSQGRINIVPFILVLHESLALGTFGTWTLGIIALAWTLDCFLAFYLTLPRGVPHFVRRWLPSWLIKHPTAAFRLNFDLHRASGLWFWPLLFVFAWSSVMFNLFPVYTAVTDALFSYTPFDESVQTLHRHVATDHPKLDWRAAERRGAELVAEQARQHGFRILRPFGIGYLSELGVYTYEVRTDEDVGGRTWETGVWLDGNTGILQKTCLPSDQEPGDRISTWLYALHWADFHDWFAYRALVALLGLVITGLSVTGIVIWWIKRRARRFAHRRTRVIGELA